MSKRSLRTKLCSVALGAVMATTAFGAIVPAAHAEEATQQYLASENAPTISATKDQVNLPFAPELYYSYSLLSNAGKQVWDWTLKELLAFDSAKNYQAPITLTTEKNGNGNLTFDLAAKGINATPADIKDLYKYLSYNEPRMFFFSGWSSTKHTVDGQELVQTITFKIYKTWMPEHAYQDKLVEMESTISTILSGIDPRQNDAQRLNAFYDSYLEKEHYINAGMPGSMTGAFDGKAICGGYSKGFEYLAMRAGVEAVYLLGGAAGGYHAWNSVKLDDGNWYVIDSTWDDVYGNHGASNRSYFLKGAKATTDHSMYGDTYSVMPAISASNYSMDTWVAPEDVLPQSKKAIDQIASVVKNTFSASSYLIPRVTKVTATLPASSSSSGSLEDGIFQNNLKQNLKSLKLPGTASITISTENGPLNTVDDVLSKGLTIEYTVPGTTDTYQYLKGQFTQKSTGTVYDDADVAAKVLEMAQKTTSRILQAHRASVGEISGIMLTLPTNAESPYTPKTETEQQVVDQLTANLQGKFNGELSVMVNGGYSSTDALISKGLVIGYKNPSGAYYTLMGDQVIASQQ